MLDNVCGFWILMWKCLPQGSFEWVNLFWICSTIFILVMGIAKCLSLHPTYYFKKRAIKCHPGGLPFFGHWLRVLLAREHIRDLCMRCYRDHPHDKYVGCMLGRAPYVVVRDLELIKRILVSDFDHFRNHFDPIKATGGGLDPLLENALFLLRDDEWRKMKASLTPAFNSLKIKEMYGFMAQTGDQVIKNLTNQIKSFNSENPVDIEINDLCGRYLNDVIASTTFGLVIDSCNAPNNHFYKMGLRASSHTIVRVIKYQLATWFPKLTKYLGYRMVEPEVMHFFRSLVLNTLKFREKENIVRRDMLHFLQEIKNDAMKSRQKEVWTDDVIVSQAMVFFIGGFGNTSVVICYLIYELATNPTAQKKLQSEVDEMMTRSMMERRAVTYDDLCDMKYLDMVICETLRKWPVAIMTDRECSKPFELPPSSENDVSCMLQPGDTVTIPIYALQNDPQYFPEPDKFVPERFSAENWRKIRSFSYLPFGGGPRSCIGQKFALAMVRSIVFRLVANFEFVRTAKTKFPTPMNGITFGIDAKTGLWIGFKLRKK